MTSPRTSSLGKSAAGQLQLAASPDQLRSTPVCFYSSIAVRPEHQRGASLAARYRETEKTTIPGASKLQGRPETLCPRTRYAAGGLVARMAAAQNSQLTEIRSIVSTRGSWSSKLLRIEVSFRWWVVLPMRRTPRCIYFHHLLTE